MIEVQRAGVKDHGTVTALLLEFADGEGWEPEVDRDRWERVVAELLNTDSWLFLLAYQGEEAVGLAVANFCLTLYGSREQARLTVIIVDGEHRRQGVGSALFEGVLGAVRRRGCRELEVSIGPGEEAIERFYSRFGYGERRITLAWPGGRSAVH